MLFILWQDVQTFWGAQSHNGDRKCHERFLLSERVLAFVIALRRLSLDKQTVVHGQDGVARVCSKLHMPDPYS